MPDLSLVLTFGVFGSVLLLIGAAWLDVQERRKR